MKQFMHVVAFEFMGNVKNKIYLGITVAIIVLLGVGLSIPRIIELFKSDTETVNESAITNGDIILLKDTASSDRSILVEALAAALPNKKIEITERSVDELKKMVDEEEYACAVVITSFDKYTYIVKNQNLYDNTRGTIGDILLNLYRMEKMNELGISYEESAALLSVSVESEVIQTGVNQFNNYFYTLLLVTGLYLVIMLYGQNVASSVAKEKSSRAMELLITSAKPTRLMFGKVISSALSGLFQVLVALVSMFVFYTVNKSYWADNEIVNSIFNMPPMIIFYTIVFFLLGFFIFAFLFGAVGSLVSKIEDMQSAVMPLTLLSLISFYVPLFSLSSGQIDSMLMKVCSYIPFTSPMAMFTRIAMSGVGTQEIAISIGILLVSIVGAGYLAAKIYEVGVLLYGKAPKWNNLLKVMKSAK